MEGTKACEDVVGLRRNTTLRTLRVHDYNMIAETVEAVGYTVRILRYWGVSFLDNILTSALDLRPSTRSLLALGMSTLGHIVLLCRVHGRRGRIAAPII